MTRRDVVLVCGFGLLISALGCDGGDDDDDGDDDGEGAGGNGRGEHDAGGRDQRPNGSGLPLLCPSCDRRDVPGGDTTDFGAGQDAPCDGRFVRRDLTLEEAQLEGLELDADLAVAEGQHALSVHWRDPERTRTTLSVELHRTGRARLTGWENEPRDDTRWLDYPACPDEWTVVLPEVEVRVSTADQSVVGVFMGLLETRARPVLYPGSVEWARPDPWWLVTGDGSKLRGNARFTGEGEPDALEVSVGAVDDEEARAGITLSWLWWDQEGWRSDSDGWTQLEPRQIAVPPDGCQVFDHPLDSGSCDPWTQQGCCGPSGQRIEYVRPDSDDDAGTAAR